MILPMIALTFDDGPGPTTPEILDALKAHRVLATFFVIGRNVVESPWTDDRNAGWSIVKRAIIEGHTVGNHTYTHAREAQNELEFCNEVEKTDHLIQELMIEAGLSLRVPPLRLPFGLRPKDARLNFIGSLGRTHVHWSTDFDDWHEGAIERLFPEILAYIETRTSMGLNSVLDLHDGGIGGESGYRRPATADAVRRLLDESKKRGWEFFQSPVAL
jgi:chitin deacetylase